MEGGGLIGAVVATLLRGARRSAGLALLGLAAPCDPILGNLVVSGQVAGSLATWLRGPSFQSAAFQQLGKKNTLSLPQLSQTWITTGLYTGGFAVRSLRPHPEVTWAS